MAIQTLPLESVLASASLDGATTANLVAQDASWATASSNNTDTSVQAAMPTPSGDPAHGADLQTITVQTRKSSVSGSGSPTGTISVGSQGVKALASASFPIDSTTGQTDSFAFDFSSLLAAASDGSDLEVWIETVKAGGTALVRASADIGYIGWTVNYTEPGGGAARRPARHSFWI